MNFEFYTGIPVIPVFRKVVRRVKFNKKINFVKENPEKLAFLG